MKKLLYCAAALATMLFSACQQENFEPAAKGTAVRFSVQTPDGIATKAVADGTNVDELHYAIYKYDEQAPNHANAVQNPNSTPLAKGVVEKTSDRNFDVTFDLLADQNYIVIFWAQVSDKNYYSLGDLRTISFADGSQADGNEEARAAFFRTYEFNTTNVEDHEVKLYRPFAQLNLGTTKESLTPSQEGQAENGGYTIDVKQSEVKVTGLATSFNTIADLALEDGYWGKAEVVKEEEFVFNLADVITQGTGENAEYLTVVDKNGVEVEYEYVAMNYLFATDECNVTVEYDIVTDKGTINNTVENVPVKENFRTNIIGNLLTSKTDFEIIVDADFNTNENSGNIEVICDGLVKNMKGDYEITTSNGLAYVLNKMLDQSGNYYVTKNIDMTGVSFTSPTVPAGVVVNVYGELPVVTRSSEESFGSVTITGLTQPLIAKVEGVVSISGIILSDEGSVLVNEVAEGATLIVSDVEADTVVANGEATSADEINDLATLKAALSTGVKTITLTADIKGVSEIVVINNSVVLDGAGHTLTSTAARAINISGAEDVTIKNLTVEATGERAFNLIQKAKNVTLENVVAKSANYTVNVAGSAPNANVVINDSDLTGLNTVNIAAEGVQVNINNTTIKCADQTEIEGYAAIAVGKEGVGVKVVVNGGEIIVNGDSCAGLVVPEDAEIVLNEVSGNNDILFPKYMIDYGNNSYVIYSLSKAFETAEDGNTIKVIRDAVEEEVSVNTKNVILDLNGKTISGTDDNTSGNFYFINNTGTLAITNTSAKVAGISLEAKNNREWNSSSVVVANNPGGTLTIDSNIVIEHLGGTDMAYGVDNLTNGKGTSAVTTINGATVKSPYRAVRQFLNGVEATNELTVKTGSVLQGENRGVFFHDPSAKANTGKLVVEEGAKIGSAYLFVTAGSTEWPVEVSVAASSLDKDGLTYKNVPEGYSVEDVDGVWTVVEWTLASDAETLAKAAIEGKNVMLTDDLKDAPVSTVAPYGNYYGVKQVGGVIDGKNHTLDFDMGTKNSNGKYDNYGIMTSGGVIRNLTLTGVFRGIQIMYPTSDIVIDNVTIGDDDVCYAINTAEGDGTHSLTVSNSTIKGWSSYGTAIKDLTFTNCTFAQGTYYTNVFGRIVKPYVDTVFDSCEFNSLFYIDLSAFEGEKVVLRNCTVNGVTLTAENWTSLIASEDDCKEGQISIELKDGSYMTASKVADYVVFE